MRESKVYSIPDDEFIALIKKCNNYSDCLREIGLSTEGGSSRDTLRRRISELNCDTSHFNPYKQSNQNRKKYLMEEILVENSNYDSISRLKTRLVNENILDYKCNKCGLVEWLGEKISLQLHHKNGISNDHRIDNIEFLCPNCHSLTETYAGKNKKNPAGLQKESKKTNE